MNNVFLDVCVVVYLDEVGVLRIQWRAHHITDDHKSCSMGGVRAGAASISADWEGPGISVLACCSWVQR